MRDERSKRGTEDLQSSERGMSLDADDVETNQPGPPETRRDFLLIATGTMVAAGTALAAWPFIDFMNPSADQLVTPKIDVDIEPIEVGQRITVLWRGKPVFIDHRTPEQIAKARAEDGVALPEPQPDSARVQRDEWLIVIGICTHLGCIPLGQRVNHPRGGYGGWFCACHGSHYDTSGRIRKGPAPRNLDLPPYTFIDETRVRIG